MKTLEDILQGVTPPETWHVCKDHGNNYAIMPDKEAYIAIAQFLSKRDAALILRAARNFAPLVRALEGLLYSNNVQGGPTQALSNARKALREALADEP